jgi:DNA-binding NtrC family response regulator
LARTSSFFFISELAIIVTPFQNHADLPSVMRFSVMTSSVPFRPLAEEETAYVRRVLASVGGNKSKAAEILRIDRKTLRDKLKQEENEIKF